MRMNRIKRAPVISSENSRNLESAQAAPDAFGEEVSCL